MELDFEELLFFFFFPLCLLSEQTGEGEEEYDESPRNTTLRAGSCESEPEVGGIG